MPNQICRCTYDLCHEMGSFVEHVFVGVGFNVVVPMAPSCVFHAMPASAVSCFGLGFEYLVELACQALLGAMEQQEVTVSKAGLSATMPAETGVIGAANPADGHYHRGKTVMENLKLSDAMLSRFDLIFLLLDRPDEIQDQLLSEHILALHAGETLNVLRNIYFGPFHFAPWTCVLCTRDPMNFCQCLF
jgi:MCM P-loop domain